MFRSQFHRLFATQAYKAGLYRTTYSGYFNDTVSWFDTATVTATAVDSTLAVVSILGTTSYQYLGYFRPTTTETYTFQTTSDDGSWLWVGDSAKTGTSTANALINNGGLHGNNTVSGSISLTANQYYPIRIQCGNNGGPGDISVQFSTTSISLNNNFTGIVFYNPVTNGF